MRIQEQVFSASVELPCRLFCGPDGNREYSGVALNIETGRLLLNLGELYGSWMPVVGEEVRLELSLPVQMEEAGANYLSLRAKVSGADARPDGSLRLELKFRKPSFKQRRAAQVPAVAGWKM